MRVLRFRIDGLPLFEGGRLSMDLYATDNVRNTVFTSRVLGESSPIRILNAVGVAGLNASGKTTILRAVYTILMMLQGAAMSQISDDLAPLVGMMGEPVRTDVIFAHKAKVYRLESTLSHGSEGHRHPLSFQRERLRVFSGKMSKAMLAKAFDFSLEEHWKVVTTRGFGEPGVAGELSKETMDYLPQDRSIAAALLKNVKMTTAAELTPLMQRRVAANPAHEVLQLFDPSIEEMRLDDDKATLKFREREEQYVLNPMTLLDMVSAGTIRGGYLLTRALDVLREGGYMLVDEIENSINKQLVFTLMDLFASPSTNPKGSVLVFTTHYPELLDHFSRKDNIWFAVRPDGQSFRLAHLADALNRSDVRKSVAFFADLVTGTAPSSDAVRECRDYVRSVVHA